MDQPTPLPSRCDVLVVGAGPAGSACAHWLARAGLDVLLADQHVFPRDKVCGDGLIADTHAALRRLGVYEEVAALAAHAPHVRCIAPRGAFVDVAGTLSVLPRKTLDHILVRAAQRAGARLLAPLRFEAPLLEGERVVGARFQADGGVHEITARWVVLATGAVPQALIAAGLCERRTPSGVALRGYVRHEAMVGRITQLQLVWHPRLRGGYGWIFPAPGGLFNIGTGLTGSHVVQRNGKGHMHNVNLRDMLDAFCDVYAPARELMTGGELQGDFKGAPLRCTLRGARWSRPGLLVTGEAAGSTYAFSGEGIGKAMETGLLAAEALLASPRQGADDDAVRQRYEAALALAAAAGSTSTRPPATSTCTPGSPTWWSGAPGAARASGSRLSGILEETQNPGRLFSWSGMTKLMFE